MQKEKAKNLKLGLLRGESWAFEEMYINAFKSVEILIKRNSGTMDDAKDIFQESLLVLVKRLRTPSFELKVLPNTFVYSIARNLWYKRLRSKKSNPEDLILDETDTGVKLEIVDEGELNFELDEFNEEDPIQKLAKEKLNQLSDICREVIIMKYVYDFTHQEIIEETGDTEAYARIRLFNCMNQLRKLIKKELDID